MPNWGPDYCLNHAIDNEKQDIPWYDKDDSHCTHPVPGKPRESVCCWCRQVYVEVERNHRHGPHEPGAERKLFRHLVPP